MKEFNPPYPILKTFFTNPYPKPRMTNKDRWLSPPRKPVQNYRNFCKLIQLQRRNFILPAYAIHIIFFVEMPKSWSDRKKKINNLQPHTSNKADSDNLTKALFDALENKDGHLWDHRVSKFWSYEGRITIAQLPNTPVWTGADFFNPKEKSKILQIT